MTLHRAIEELIKVFRLELEFILKDKLYGLYLYNSVAMGNFEPSYSDIDFMVILNSTLSSHEIDKLIKLHKMLSGSYEFGSRLEGMYLQYDDIGKLNNELKPYPYIDGDSFCKAGHFDINYVTWWSLKKYNARIDSPSISSELSEIKWESVLRSMVYNLNNYWVSKLNDISRFEEDSWVEFGVVTLSRIIYTLEQNDIISKSEACNYIMEKYNEYQDIVNEALAIRALEPRSIINNIDLRRDKAIDFLQYGINYGNTLLKETCR